MRSAISEARSDHSCPGNGGSTSKTASRINYGTVARLSHEKIPEVNTCILMKPLMRIIGVVFVCAVDCHTMIFVAMIGTSWTEGEPVVNPDIGNA